MLPQLPFRQPPIPVSGFMAFYRKPWFPFTLPFLLYFIAIETARHLPQWQHLLFLAGISLAGAALWSWRARFLSSAAPPPGGGYRMSDRSAGRWRQRPVLATGSTVGLAPPCLPGLAIALVILTGNDNERTVHPVFRDAFAGFGRAVLARLYAALSDRA